MKKKRVIVLLAAYNGQQWLATQIDSILKQENVNVSLIISLDASDDDSLDICNKYVEDNSNILMLSYGLHFGGAGKNFYRLLKDTDFSNFDYIAFSDQDDIWHSDKLFRATEMLQDYDCYSSNVTAFWQDGREVLIDKAQPQLRWDYLFEAAGPGCTYVFKHEFAMYFKQWLITNYDTISNNITLHDWLLYAFARHHKYSWFIDPVPSMQYRQHANNQVGANNSFSAAKKRLLMIKTKWYRNELIKLIKVLGVEDIPLVTKGVSNGYLGNLYLLYHVNQIRRRFRDRIAFVIVCIFGLF